MPKKKPKNVVVLSDDPRALMLADLARSGLTAKDADAAGFRSLSRQEAKKITKQYACAGYLIPYGARQGFEAVFRRLRFTGEVLPRGDDGKEIRYWQPPGSANHLYVPPNFPPREGGRLYITEGEKKAFAACRAGFACVALGGVNSFTGPAFHALTEIVRGRDEVAIAFDSDLASNRRVLDAEAALGKMLKQAGVPRVVALRLPAGPGGGKVGLDDFLKEHGAAGLKRVPAVEPGAGGLGAPDTVPLADVEAKRVDFLWWPYLPRGKLTLYEGDPGTLKSFSSLKIAAAVSCGEKLPGAATAVTGTVLLLSAEDGLADTVRPRLDRMRASLKNIIAVRDLFTLDAAGIAALDALLTKHRPLLVVIDPLVAYMGAEVDLHRANETRALTARLAELAERHGAAILAVRHWRKATTDKSIYRGVGSIDLSAAARSILITGRDESGGHVFAHAKSNVGPLGPSISFRLVGDDEHEVPRFEWLGQSALTAEQIAAPPKAPGRPATARERAERFLTDHLDGAEVKAADLEREAAERGITRNTLKAAKRELKIVTEKRGRTWWWKLPPRGRK